MDNQPAVDRSLLIPILLSGFSVIGILVVLLIGRSLSAPPEVPMTPSATRFLRLPGDGTRSQHATDRRH